MSRFRFAAGLGLFALLASSTAAFADPTLSVYGGWQTAPHSGVDVTDGTHFTAGWDGKSFDMPPYWGVRGTWWLDEWGYSDFGIALDYSHSKVYARESTLNKTGWTHFEFTDGLHQFLGDRGSRHGIFRQAEIALRRMRHAEERHGRQVQHQVVIPAASTPVD